jgi:hypothetical protein
LAHNWNFLHPGLLDALDKMCSQNITDKHFWPSCPPARSAVAVTVLQWKWFGILPGSVIGNLLHPGLLDIMGHKCVVRILTVKFFTYQPALLIVTLFQWDRFRILPGSVIGIFCIIYYWIYRTLCVVRTLPLKFFTCPYAKVLSLLSCNEISSGCCHGESSFFYIMDNWM